VPYGSGAASPVAADRPRANHRGHGLRLSHAQGLKHRRLLDNGPEFVASVVCEWLTELGVTTLCIEPASPRENGSVESFNDKLRDELLNGERFYTTKEAQILIEQWRREYDHLRPHNSLGGRPPAPEKLLWPGFPLIDFAPPALTRAPARALS